MHTPLSPAKTPDLPLTTQVLPGAPSAGGFADFDGSSALPAELAAARKETAQHKAILLGVIGVLELSIRLGTPD
jgi:hypothetical protein